MWHKACQANLLDGAYIQELLFALNYGDLCIGFGF